MTQQSATATTKSRRRYFATPLLFVLPFQLALLPAINAFQTSTSSQSNRHQISPLSRPLLFDLHRRYATVSGEKTSSSANDNNRDSHSSLQTERFHQDMRRVLNSRRKVLEDQHDIDDTTRNNNEKTDHLERRRRPDILESDLDGAERVLIMLKRMVELGLATEETFQIAMRACLQRGRQRWYRQSDRTQVICAADQLEELVDQLRGVVGKVSLETYNLVLEAYAICSTPRGGRNYARRADFLLQRMEEEGLFDSGNGTIGEELNEEIPAETLAHVLHAWAWQQANLQPEDCAERAQEYLFEIQHNSTKPVDTALLLQCYEWVLEAWSKSGSEGSAQNADDIFCRMKELNKTQAESTILSTQSYSNAILAWSKCKDPRSPERAHELLMEMIKHYDEGAFSNSEPELIAFNGVITAWARIGKPKMAEKVLWLADTLRLKCQNLIPNVFTYNSVLQSHVRNPNKKEALERIRNLVDYMEMNAVEQPEIKPNSFTYNCLMKAWIQSGQPDLAERAEKILQKMTNLSEKGDGSVEPTNRHFNVVINAYAKSSDPFAAKKAHNLLQQMKGGSLQSKPDIISYTTVIECLSKSAEPNAAQTAIDLLDEAFAVHAESGDPSLRPNLRTFTMVILTLSKCNGSPAKAKELLAQLIDLYEETGDEALKPNTFPFNYCLDCCANSLGDKMKAFRVATHTYQEMRESPYVSPDSFTYAFWFKCCNNLLDDNDLKAKCMFYAFDECRKDGLVSNTVLNRLQRAVAPKVLQQWLDLPDRKKGFKDIKVEDFPPNWSRNAQR